MFQPSNKQTSFTSPTFGLDYHFAQGFNSTTSSIHHLLCPQRLTDSINLSRRALVSSIACLEVMYLKRMLEGEGGGDRKPDVR